MEIMEYFEAEDKEYWLQEIEKSDWGAGKFLHRLLKENELKRLCGETTKVLLLTEEKELVAFCTLAELDDIRDTELTPWIGFVYTFPAFRGHRYMGILLEHAKELAKENGAEHIYIDTNHVGLYEKYGYSFYQIMKDMEGNDSKVYRIDV